MKDPKSKDSKTRLRETLKDQGLVDQFNLHCLNIVKSNILSLDKDGNKIVIINNSSNRDYIEELGLSKFSILDINEENIGKSMHEVHEICAPFADRIVLSGSDIPELTSKHLSDSVNYLSKFDSYIIGTKDGGGIVVFLLN